MLPWKPGWARPTALTPGWLLDEGLGQQLPLLPLPRTACLGPWNPGPTRRGTGSLFAHLPPQEANLGVSGTWCKVYQASAAVLSIHSLTHPSTQRPPTHLSSLHSPIHHPSIPPIHHPLIHPPIQPSAHPSPTHSLTYPCTQGADIEFLSVRCHKQTWAQLPSPPLTGGTPTASAPVCADVSTGQGVLHWGPVQLVKKTELVHLHPEAWAYLTWAPVLAMSHGSPAQVTSARGSRSPHL